MRDRGPSHLPSGTPDTAQYGTAVPGWHAGLAGTLSGGKGAVVLVLGAAPVEWIDRVASLPG